MFNLTKDYNIDLLYKKTSWKIRRKLVVCLFSLFNSNRNKIVI